MMRFTMFIMALLLASCGTLPNKDKREWLSVSCSGFANWEKCYQKANNLCPNGFDTANKEENLVTQGRTMKVSCK